MFGAFLSEVGVRYLYLGLEVINTPLLSSKKIFLEVIWDALIYIVQVVEAWY